MKRNLVYFFLLLGVAALTYYLVRFKSSGTLNVDEQNFSVSDTAAIGKMFIADMRGNKVELERNGTAWTMNNRTSASKEAVDMMLGTLSKMAVRYPVPDATRKNVVKEMSGNNKKLVLYDRDGKEIKTILIGPTPLDNRGNYMLIEGASNPYVVEIPGFQGSLDTRFITDTMRLRNAAILAFPFNALVEVSVAYTDSPKNSFVLDLSKDAFSVTNPSTGSTLAEKTLDKNKVFAYVNLFRRVNAEAYENNNPIRTEILAQRPFAVLTVTQRGGNQTRIECYNKPMNRRSKTQFEQTGDPVQFDLDRYYGLVNGNDFVLLQRYHFGQLLRTFDHFKV